MTRIILVGGFLGAGKTTLLLCAARKLVQRGYRVGLVTNDQGHDLVDTALGTEAAVPVTEVVGGCFCCRFPDLMASLEHLQTAAQPDIILAEPVGSCTDLVATVLRPLTQFYGEQYELAPLTVLLDCNRNVSDFPAEVRYLYQQQLAEAELLLLSKSDQMTPQQRMEQLNVRQALFPQAHILPVSAQSGEGVERWLDVVLGQTSANPEALVIDYERYAAAEAALGWLNAKGQVRADTTYSVRRWMDLLLSTLDTLCRRQSAGIAHIKAMATVQDSIAHALSGVKLKAGLSQSGTAIEWDLESSDALHSGAEASAHEFILNAGVNTTPARLEEMVIQAVEAAKPSPSSRDYIEQLECFSPLPPKPVHRL